MPHSGATLARHRRDAGATSVRHRPDIGATPVRRRPDTSRTPARRGNAHIGATSARHRRDVGSTSARHRPDSCPTSARHLHEIGATVSPTPARSRRDVGPTPARSRRNVRRDTRATINSTSARYRHDIIGTIAHTVLFSNVCVILERQNVILHFVTRHPPSVTLRGASMGLKLVESLRENQRFTQYNIYRGKFHYLLVASVNTDCEPVG